eukprot:SAG11_NODE_1146_length_5684_cov_59.423277_3_plen_235_part_00
MGDGYALQVEMRQNIPMCERCTSTLRKHWSGQTTSRNLCRDFLQYVAKVQCRTCESFVAGDVARQRGDMICDACDASGSAEPLAPADERPSAAHHASAAADAAGANSSAVNDDGGYLERTPARPPTQYVFLYGDSAAYRAALQQHISGDSPPAGSSTGEAKQFECWSACSGDCPGHVYALSDRQMAQLDAIFVGDAVRTAITVVIYTPTGETQQLAASTYCTPETLSTTSANTS